MSQQNKKSIPRSFAVCDVQKEYVEHLFTILSEKLFGEYQFYLFHDPEKLSQFLGERGAQFLLVGEECRKNISNTECADRIFVLSDTEDENLKGRERRIFRYQSAETILENIRRGMRNEPEQKKRKENKNNEPGKIKGQERIRDEPEAGGLIGIYSPVHRIGKTRFAIHTGQRLSEQFPVLYVNLEGYSGGNLYFQDELRQDLGDLVYCMKQERSDYGLKISSMAGQSGGMDYIMPMQNECDLRGVTGEEWISMFNLILEQCMYEAIVLDLGDCINGLYDILLHCTRIYTPYIKDTASLAKLEQYEKNIRTAGYGEILKRTVKIQMQKKRNGPEKVEEILC